ncbi:MAG TPA: enoyl-CoA hydratase-related protein [Anaeromyxobacteraceae bacterium]|nr:enoyl-CoA hydratase-related protein [Anaeromyxobacteraceae bacterium]
MAYENLLYEVRDGVGLVTMNRPKALNALNGATIADLDACLASVERDAAVRALVVTGAGDKAFVAGADIAEMASMTPEQARAFGAAGQRAFARLEALPIPTIAAVNGFALGGGGELALACDLVYASEKARFGQPEVTLGLIPAWGGTQRLARRVGAMRALEIVLGGDMVDSARAREMGLCLEVLPPEKLLDHAFAKARTIASRGPLAVAAAKRVLRAGADAGLAQGLALESEAFGLVFATEDMREGTKAFLEKRPARFQGK